MPLFTTLSGGGTGSGGPAGPRGESAFDAAKRNGFTGTEQQWLDSLKGRSAYQTAVDEGVFTGTEAEFAALLTRPQRPPWVATTAEIPTNLPVGAVYLVGDDDVLYIEPEPSGLRLTNGTFQLTTDGTAVTAVQEWGAAAGVAVNGAGGADIGAMVGRELRYYGLDGSMTVNGVTYTDPDGVFIVPAGDSTLSITGPAQEVVFEATSPDKVTTFTIDATTGPSTGITEVTP